MGGGGQPGQRLISIVQVSKEKHFFFLEGENGCVCVAPCASFSFDFLCLLRSLFILDVMWLVGLTVLCGVSVSVRAPVFMVIVLIVLVLAGLRYASRSELCYACSRVMIYTFPPLLVNPECASCVRLNHCTSQNGSCAQLRLLPP